ncbi:hypothetical protein EJ05DRAFT_475488 [Pseudovirgaria hyperparasitica]|uniref:Mnd1 HTH domain-containing protein n=1 Tax=Pseudovirgaria hyperparasitica TaxID=470096 RepID=A0A6A6W9M7_9PEZI|nr:uncharacterized protein EJ05DRAFT_475488 [Pseudovirgaria hyperparasitica]KAF2759265.1 hypothetical protein EJ05DRAFT_475488 [Pseudovirgaria hyperparasitica]
MAVKDYLQALADENQIHVEKIGSGNWYWSFPSEERKLKEAQLDVARDEFERAETSVQELQAKVDEASEAREDDGADGMDRGELMERSEGLKREVEQLKKELMGYSQNDPVEMERKRGRVEACKGRVESTTDHILSMEGWLKAQCGGSGEGFVGMLEQSYGDEFDDESGSLREL